MRIMERLIQKVDRSSWAKKIALEKRYEPVEARLGYPPSRRYRAHIGRRLRGFRSERDERRRKIGRHDRPRRGRRLAVPHMTRRATAGAITVDECHERFARSV